MKITIEVDCTPEEARTFLGLPDVQPLQAVMMAEIEQKMAKSMSMMEPEALIKSWFPQGMQGFESFQKMMWDSARSAMDTHKPSGPDKGK